MKAGERDYIILHPLGSTYATGRTAAEALGKAFIPEGFRNALAIVESDLIRASLRPPGHPAPFVAIIAAPASIVKGDA